jgi:hypothetical protein
LFLAEPGFSTSGFQFVSEYLVTLCKYGFRHRPLVVFARGDSTGEIRICENRLAFTVLRNYVFIVLFYDGFLLF